ncbi:unnamed protein product [Amoebophrya sp. A120]|nr:unnamed protein product [Amoebophrya sp. A120]|eukprot:GSA120T00001462001.1
MGNHPCCCQTVANDRIAVMARCGKFDKLAHPGLLLVPCPCICVRIGEVSTRLQETIVRCETKTKDNVFVNMEVSIQYEILRDKVYDAFYRLSEPHVQISSYVFDVVRAAVPLLLIDDVFEQKEEIANQIKGRLSVVMSSFGFNIVQALVTDISPNLKVKDAMNEINAAFRSKQAAKEKAEADKIVLVKQAEADAESKYLQGTGIAKQRKAIVDGLRDSVDSFTTTVGGMAAKDVLELVLVTQYFDTMKDIGCSSQSKTIFVPNNPGAITDITEEIRTGFMQGQAGNV